MNDNINRYEEGIRKLIKELGLEASHDKSDLLGRAYNRVLTSEEKKLMDTDSFGYLLSLYLMGTIDSIKLEKYIDYSLTVAYYEREKLSLERTKRIVGMLLFFESTTLKSKDFVSFFKECEEEICELDTIN